MSERAPSLWPRAASPAGSSASCFMGKPCSPLPPAPQAALPPVAQGNHVPLCPSPRQLCLLLHAESIFHSMADILLREEDLTFASTMVHTLNTILLTSTELFQLRNQLKDLKTPVLLTCELQPASFVCARARPCQPSPRSPEVGGEETRMRPEASQSSVKYGSSWVGCM